MVFFLRSLVFAISIFVMAGPSHADHMNGRYYGTAQVAGYILQLNQSGTFIQATISTPSGQSFQLTGNTDGNNYGSGRVGAADTGSFDLQWSQQGIMLNMRGQRQSGQGMFANTPPPQHTAPPRQRPQQDTADWPGGQEGPQDGGDNTAQDVAPDGPPTEGGGAVSGMPNVD